MRISRRAFLAAAGAAAPLSGALLTWNAPPRKSSVTCALDESRAGYDKALIGSPIKRLLVFPAAVGWDPSIASRVRDGATVLFESAAGFG
ncbi:MAG: twin-arginine translocation signal domain-containing protein, partial [Vicinamibacteria bacterium]